ncbi:hypothetical protein V8C35DRAFT_316814 [Trichoderma chlorosporum]
MPNWYIVLLLLVVTDDAQLVKHQRRECLVFFYRHMLKLNFKNKLKISLFIKTICYFSLLPANAPITRDFSRPSPVVCHFKIELILLPSTSSLRCRLSLKLTLGRRIWELFIPTTESLLKTLAVNANGRCDAIIH